MPNSWVFQADPEFYDVDEALRTFSEHTWLVQQHRKEIHAGDKVFVWRGGGNPAILAKGLVTTEPVETEPDPQESRFLLKPLRFSGKRWRVRIKTERITAPLTKARMLADPALSSWYLLSGLEGTNFKVSAEVEAALEKLIASLAARSATGTMTTTSGD